MTRDGLRYRLDISQVIDHGFYFFDRSYVPELLFRLVEADTVFIDIGANVGTAALRVARQAGRGVVHAYEPSSSSFTDLTVNAGMNGLANLCLHRKAMGDQPGRKELYEVNPYNRGMNRFLSTKADRETQVEVVEVATLDGEVARLGLNHLDLIKIDAEGYEGHIIDGGIGTLAKFRPKLIIEITDANLRLNGRTSAQILARLSELDYTCKDVVTGRTPNANQGLETDIICCPNRR